MPATVVPSFVLGVVLAFPAALISIPLWGAIRAVLRKVAALVALAMWALAVAIFAFVVTGLHWPAYGALAFIVGNVVTTAGIFSYVWRRRPMRLR